MIVARRLPPCLLALALGCLSLGCGSSTAPTRTISPFTAEDARFFEDGVDFVADPEALEGRWREDWSEELDGRIGLADFVGLVTVTTMRTDTDLDRHTTYRLITTVERELLGDSDEEITLTIREGEAGFGTIAGNERRILNQPFIAFLKYYQREGTEGEAGVDAHFHLSPATEGVVRRAEYLLERRRGVRRERQGRRTVIVH